MISETRRRKRNKETKRRRDEFCKIETSSTSASLVTPSFLTTFHLKPEYINLERPVAPDLDRFVNGEPVPLLDDVVGALDGCPPRGVEGAREDLMEEMEEEGERGGVVVGRGGRALLMMEAEGEEGEGTTKFRRGEG